MDYTSRHQVPLDSQKKTLAEQGIGLDKLVVVNRVVQDNMPGAVSLEQVREETDKDPVLSKVMQRLMDHDQDPSDKTHIRQDSVLRECTQPRGAHIHTVRCILQVLGQ